MAPFHQGGGNVRPACRLAPGEAQNIVIRQRKPEPVQLFHNMPVARRALRAQGFKPRLQGRGAGGNPQAEQVHFAVRRGRPQLAPSDDFQVQLAAGLHGLVQTGEGVVIRYRHGRKAKARRLARQFRRRVGSVRRGGVRVQIHKLRLHVSPPAFAKAIAMSAPFSAYMQLAKITRRR